MADMKLLPALVDKPEVNKVYNCDALTYLKAIPAETVNCIITSPPYFNLRIYSDGNPAEIGREPLLADYIQNLVAIFRECRRVLKSNGNFFLNMGDTYSASGRGGNPPDPQFTKQGPNAGSYVPSKRETFGFKPKDLLMVPHRLAIALQDDGWWVRQDNVWAKPNPMPESVTDRTTRAHEYMFHLTKSETYWYNAEAIKEPAKEVSKARQLRGHSDHHKNVNGAPGQTAHSMHAPRLNVHMGGGNFSKRYAGAQPAHGGQSHRKAYEMANKRSVFTVPVIGFKDAHFATFPPNLIKPFILAGCPVGGIVLDPFLGAGTTAFVSERLGRYWMGCELNPEYVEMIRKRLNKPYMLDIFTAIEMQETKLQKPALEAS